MHVLTAVILSTCAMSATPSGELLDFTAKWCGPCQQMGPIVDRLHRQGYPIRKVDVDENRELARKYNISTIPAFVLVVNGTVVEQQVGSQSERDLLRLLAKIPKAPEFVPGLPDAPTFVKDSSTVNARTLVVTPAAPAWKQSPRSERGILPPSRFGWGRKDSAEVAKGKAISPDDVRAKRDEEPLNTAEILTQDPMQASIRIRIVDQEGTNLGSGTIIQSKTGHTVILTCGHIFRNFQQDSVVEVDVFQGGQHEMFVGKHIQHDLATDLGLISIATDNPLPYVEVASGGYRVQKNLGVVSVGCGKGSDPKLEKHVVTNVDRYKGPSNIECTGVPVQGCSGGGLFNRAGQLIGICRAADEQGHRGLYVGLPAVHKFMQSCGLVELLKNVPSSDTEFEDSSATFLAESEPRRQPLKGVAALQAALGDDAEGVICIVKADRNSQRGDRVVVLPRRSGGRQIDLANSQTLPGHLRPTSIQK